MVATVAIIASMRPKVKQSKQHRARGVSLPPELEKAALAKAFKMDVSFSKYIQRLIGLDLKRNFVKQ